MVEPGPKPRSLKLVRVEPPQWKKEFELTVEAFAEGAARLELRCDPRAVTIIQWMRQGDLRPLAGEIAEGKVLEPSIGRALAELIAERRLTVKKEPGSLGAGKQPGLLARNLQMSLAFHEQRKSLGYEAALQKVADDFCVSPEKVRNAVTQMREIAGGN